MENKLRKIWLSPSYKEEYDTCSFEEFMSWMFNAYDEDKEFYKSFDEFIEFLYHEFIETL